MFKAKHETEMPTHADPAGEAAGVDKRRLPLFAQYGLAIVLAAAATLVAFVADQVVAAPGLTLIFVIPVVVAATLLGWGPSVVAIAVSVMAFDFFFTQPYFTFRMSEPSEIWAAGLLLVTAAIMSTVAGQSRRHAREARRAAVQAEALRTIAHAIIANRPQAEVIAAAATGLSRIFAAPAVVYAETEGRLRLEATAGGTEVSEADNEAAEKALQTHMHLRGDTYPNDHSLFDFWPVATPTPNQYVLGVNFERSRLERPADPDRFIEIVGAYVASTHAAQPDLRREA